MNSQQAQDIVERLKKGQVGVMPTDTIYGIVALVRYRESIERIYNLKSRHSGKPFIVLISDLTQLPNLGVRANGRQLKAAASQWPGPTSVILPCPEPALLYLHRGLDSLAVRMPKPAWLRDMIKQTGPMAATSANLAGQSISDNIKEIKNQLPGLDFYIEGKVGKDASKLLRAKIDGSLEQLNR